MSRIFSDEVRQQVYNEQGGRCKMCGSHFSLSQMEADHIKPYAEGGPTTKANCQMLCGPCHQKKTDRQR